jgi:hypothetical protein
MDPGVGLDAMKRGEKFLPLLGIESRLARPQPVTVPTELARFSIYIGLCSIHSSFRRRAGWYRRPIYEYLPELLMDVMKEMSFV